MYQVSLGVSGVVCPVAMSQLVARGISPTEHSFSPSLPHSLSIRNKDKCGSQPACLNHVQERRRPLKTHQSESFLPLGMYHPRSLTHYAAVRGCTALTSLQKPCFREHALFAQGWEYFKGKYKHFLLQNVALYTFNSEVKSVT